VTDLDNDGLADILAAGLAFFHVLRGTGGGSFAYANQIWGGIASAASLPDSGFAFGDIDGDGDLDLLGYKAGASKDMAVYRNDLPAQKWIKVRPIGLPGNRAAAGAKIRVYQAGTTQLLWYEEIQIHAKQVLQSSYNFAETERHFGLGMRDSVDVAVQFTPSNKVVRRDRVPAGSTVRVDETGAGTIVGAADAAAGTDGGGGANSDGSTAPPGVTGGGSAGGCSCGVAATAAGWVSVILPLLLLFAALVRVRGKATDRWLGGGRR
jgi:MYXO-CTERM domain-containing protein